MKIAVQDANIVFDLHEAGILAKWFGMDAYEVWMTEEVYSEVTGEVGGELALLREVGKLHIHAFTGEELIEAGEYAATAPSALSFPDATALFLAERLGAILLTGDKPMRDNARSRSIEVHGSLWILEEMVKAGNLPKMDAVRVLKGLMASDRRLPMPECKRFIEKWSK